MAESSDAPRAEPFLYYARLQRVRDYLVRNIGEPLSSEQAARLANLSPNYFSTYFRSRVGVSFSRWAHAVRIAAAVQAMRSSDAGVQEVAEAVGYRDLRTFERAFKRATGMTARAFRAGVRPAQAPPARAISRQRRGVSEAEG